MRRRVHILLAIACATVCALTTLDACIDLTPISLTHDSPEASLPDVFAQDASDGAPDVDLRPPCPRCLERDAGDCQSAFAACAADPQCIQIYECATAAGCLDLASVQAVVGCGIPCAEDAGLRSQFDPPGAEILALLLCGQKACEAECPWARDP